MKYFLNNITAYFKHLITAVLGKTEGRVQDYTYILDWYKEEIELLHTKLEAAEKIIKKSTPKSPKATTPKKTKA